MASSIYIHLDEVSYWLISWLNLVNIIKIKSLYRPCCLACLLSKQHTSPRVCCHPGRRARSESGGSDRRWRGDREKVCGWRWYPSWCVCALGSSSHPASAGGKWPTSLLGLCLQPPREGCTPHPGPQASRSYPMPKDKWTSWNVSKSCQYWLFYLARVALER